jgi:hypothetical protein
VWAERRAAAPPPAGVVEEAGWARLVVGARDRAWEVFMDGSSGGELVGGRSGRGGATGAGEGWVGGGGKR